MYTYICIYIYYFKLYSLWVYGFTSWGSFGLDNIVPKRKTCDVINICMEAESYFSILSTVVRAGRVPSQHGVKQKLWHLHYLNPKVG